MPLLVLYRGQPVRRRRRIGESLLLTFVNPIAGQPGDILLVSQQQWGRHGSIEYFEPGEKPNPRALAAQIQSQTA